MTSSPAATSLPEFNDRCDTSELLVQIAA